MQLCYPAAWQSPAGEGKGKKRAFFAHFEPFHPLLRPAKQAITVPAQCATLLHRLASLLPILNDNSTRAIFLKGEVFKILRQKITENIYVKIISARLLLIDPFWISKRAYEVKGHAWLNFSSSLCVPASVKRRVTEVNPYSRFADQKQAALFCILWRHGNFSNCTGNRGKLD